HLLPWPTHPPLCNPSQSPSQGCDPSALCPCADQQYASSARHSVRHAETHLPKSREPYSREKQTLSPLHLSHPTSKVQFSIPAAKRFEPGTLFSLRAFRHRLTTGPTVTSNAPSLRFANS